MNRRDVLKNLSVATLLSGVGSFSFAQSKAQACEEETLDLVGLSQGYSEIRHRHQFTIPLYVLANPPAEGYTARCSTPLQGKTDFEGLKNRTDSEGKPLDLRAHAHTVTLTQQELINLSNGRHVTVDLSKFSHLFYFVADDATLATIKNLRASRS